MRNFAPAISMKRRSTRLAAAVMTTGAIAAVGLSGGAVANANPQCNTYGGVNLGLTNVLCQSVNGNKVDVTGVKVGDVSVLEDALSHNEITLINVENVLSNFKCINAVVTIASVPFTAQCGLL
jgi:hypothetical protein